MISNSRTFRDLKYHAFRFFYISKNHGLKSAFKSLIKFMLRIKIKPIIYLNYYRLIYRGGIEKKINNYHMILSLSDPGISSELILTGTHEELATNLLKEEIAYGWNVIDIGANIGYYALLESFLVGDRGNIYALEPVPANFELLKRNIEINNCDNIQPYRLAVSNKSGTKRMAITDASNWGSMLDLKSPHISMVFRKRYEYTIKDYIEVQTITLDKFLKDNNIFNPNLIRMDIEGYEIIAIQGMYNTLKNGNSPLKLFFEIHTNLFDYPDKLREMLINLFNIGFKPKRLIIENQYVDFRDKLDFTRIVFQKKVWSNILLEKV